MTTTMPLNEVKAHLSSVLDGVERTHDRVAITRHGRAAALIVAVEDMEALEETIALLSDPTFAEDVAEARAGRTRGESMSLAEFRAGIAASRSSSDADDVE